MSLVRNFSEIMPNCCAWKSESQKEKKILKVGHRYLHALDKLERIPVVFSPCQATTAWQKEKMIGYIKAGKSLKRVIKKWGSSQLKNHFNKLSQKMTALKYRIEPVHGGIDPLSEEESLLQTIQSLALEWKSHQELYSNKELTSRDLKKIQETSCYPKFARLLLRDSDLRNQFFTWIIRDNNEVRPFIEFPSVCQRLEESALGIRIGHFGGKGLSIKKKKGITSSPDIYKEIRLPFFDGERPRNICILNEERIVTLNGGYRIAIKEIFNLFKSKKEAPGNLEYFVGKGITNWHSHEVGWWNPRKERYEKIDLSSPEWWKSLPVFEILDKEKVEQKYGVSLKGQEWVLVASGTRSCPIINLEESHGYLEVAIPLANQQYQLLSFGKFAKTYPNTVWELLTFLANTVIGRVAYPDENSFYSNRQHAFYPFVIDSEKGKELMELLRLELLKAQHNNIIFQFAGENCAFWVQSVLKRMKFEPLPNLFKIYLLDVYPTHPFLATIFNLFRKFPKEIQRPIIKSFDRFLGSHRRVILIENGKKIFKSLLTTDSRNEQAVFLPAVLHKQIEEGKLLGVLSHGK